MKPMLVVGSLALDTIHNSRGSHPQVLGGSACFGSLAGSLFCPVQLVGVVGTDFPQSARDLFSSRQIDAEGLEELAGKTFHWEGRYSDDLASRETLRTDLNVFADFHPKIPDSYRSTPYVFLGNIAPALQLEVLEQVSAPKLVIADTMNYWIESARDDLNRVLERIDVLIINEEEARELAGKYHMVEVAQALIAMGPHIVIIKRGEYGAMLFEGDHIFSAPAYPCQEVVDPTGAGDSFAGGFLGHVAATESHSNPTLRQAVVFGSAVASFCVEGMGTERLVDIPQVALKERYQAFQRLSRFD